MGKAVMTGTVRTPDALVGLVFVCSAALKAGDALAFAVQVSRYGIVRSPEWIGFVVYMTIASEAGLGMMLVTGMDMRGWTRTVALAVLAGFSGLLVPAWGLNGSCRGIRKAR